LLSQQALHHLLSCQALTSINCRTAATRHSAVQDLISVPALFTTAAGKQLQVVYSSWCIVLMMSAVTVAAAAAAAMASVAIAVGLRSDISWSAAAR
jgi:hypothetical protein